MRTTGEILDAAKSGGPWPTHEECFWAMQALEQAWMMTQRKYWKQALTPDKEAIAKMMADNDHTMSKSCFGASPKTWLGPDRDCSNPANRKRREMSERLFDKAARGELPNQQRSQKQEHRMSEAMPIQTDTAAGRIAQLESALIDIRDRAATIENGGAWAAGLATLSLANSTQEIPTVSNEPIVG